MISKWCLVYSLLVFASIFQFAKGDWDDDWDHDDFFDNIGALIAVIVGVTFGLIVVCCICCCLCPFCFLHKSKRGRVLGQQQGKKKKYYFSKQTVRRAVTVLNSLT